MNKDFTFSANSGVDPQLLIRILAMGVLSNDQIPNKLQPFSVIGKLEHVIQNPRCNFIMLSIDAEFYLKSVTGYAVHKRCS